MKGANILRRFFQHGDIIRPDLRHGGGDLLPADRQLLQLHMVETCTVFIKRSVAAAGHSGQDLLHHLFHLTAGAALAAVKDLFCSRCRIGQNANHRFPSNPAINAATRSWLN